MAANARCPAGRARYARHLEVLLQAVVLHVLPAEAHRAAATEGVMQLVLAQEVGDDTVGDDVACPGKHASAVLTCLSGDPATCWCRVGRQDTCTPCVEEAFNARGTSAPCNRFMGATSCCKKAVGRSGLKEHCNACEVEGADSSLTHIVSILQLGESDACNLAHQGSVQSDL